MRSRVRLALLVVLPMLAAALRPALRAARPVPAAGRLISRLPAPRMLLDPNLAADASSVLAPAAQSGLAAWDSHTLSSLWDDEIHTTIYAALGLAGAYATQARCRAPFFCRGAVFVAAALITGLLLLSRDAFRRVPRPLRSRWLTTRSLPLGGSSSRAAGNQSSETSGRTTSSSVDNISRPRDGAAGRELR